jgi:hypothetical protein
LQETGRNEAEISKGKRRERGSFIQGNYKERGDEE